MSAPVIEPGDKSRFSPFRRGSSGTSTRAIAIAIAAVTAVLALVIARPFSRYKVWRQVNIFSETQRIRNFRAMDELFPAHLVHRSDLPHHFESRPTSLPSGYVYRGKTHAFDEFFERTVTTGFLVLRDDTILAERYFRGAAVDTPLTSWSVAKSIVSLLVGIAHDDGVIRDLNAPLSTYAPELVDSDYGRVPVQSALDMSSGIDFREDYDDSLSDIHTMFARIFFLGGHGESVGHYLATRKRTGPPGAHFHYASADTLALGLALRHATNMSLSEYLERKVWRPLGMEHDALWNVEDREGVELAFCCLNVRLRDYAKVGRLMARRGDWDGQRIVSEAWVRESTTADPKRAPGTLPDSSLGYQHQWWLPGSGHGAFMAIGVWGQNLYVDPSKGIVIVKTSVDPDFARNEDETVAALEAVDTSL